MHAHCYEITSGCFAEAWPAALTLYSLLPSTTLLNIHHHRICAPSHSIHELSSKHKSCRDSYLHHEGDATSHVPSIGRRQLASLFPACSRRQPYLCPLSCSQTASRMIAVRLPSHTTPGSGPVVALLGRSQEAAKV